MSHINNSTIYPKFPNKSDKANPEPVYVPDWSDLEERAQIMANYWLHVIELAKIQRAMERLGIGGANDQ